MNKTNINVSVLFRGHLSFLMRFLIFSAIGFLFCANVLFAGEGSEGGQHHLIASIGYSILAASVLAFISHYAKQPLILAYIAAGVLIGPKIGLHLVNSEDDIAVISEIGLILLLFMIGLEIDIKKLKESGKSLILTGLLQFIICVALGFGFFAMLGFVMGDGKYDLFYLAVCCGLSSTAIVVKLLYSKFELDTLAGRITLGVLVFQDIWAIVIIGVQPNLANPEVLGILMSFAKGGALVGISLVISKFILPFLFKSIAKIPELVLVASLGWCFFICSLAGYLDLSLEMGALIAGVAISTFPYNLDVIAKVVSIRDFFVTLFFVGLGMQIPNPLDDLQILGWAGIIAAFLISTRFLSIYPVLYFMKLGHRMSLLPSINLSNISEFSLVIASLGLASGHIDNRILSIIIFVFVLTSIGAPYMIKYNQKIQGVLAKMFTAIGLKDITTKEDQGGEETQKEIAFLGFFRVASSFIRDLEDKVDVDPEWVRAMKEKIIVVDYNPNVHEKLNRLGIKAVYGDISNIDTLHHAGLHDAKLVISTIPDTILVGTDNLRLIKQIQKISPHAKIIVTAESATRALKMYSEGAEYVFLPRNLSSKHLLETIECFLKEDTQKISEMKKSHMDWLSRREEIIS